MLQSNLDFGLYQQIIGLSRTSIAISAYDNAILFSDVAETFARKLLNTQEAGDIDLRYATLEIRTAREKIPRNGKENVELRQMYCTIFHALDMKETFTPTHMVLRGFYGSRNGAI